MCDEGCIHEGYGMCMDEVLMCRTRLRRLWVVASISYVVSCVVCVCTYISCRCTEAIAGYNQTDHLCSHVFALAYR